MVYYSYIIALALAFVMALSIINGNNAQDSSTLFPAIMSFGDSVMDIGNNNYHIPAKFKANYPPYGRDFINHRATGRFCNGKIPTDITAEEMGFTAYQLPYLSREASGNKLLIGASFASAGAGYDNKTSILNQAIPLSQQLQHFKEYRVKVERLVGRKRATSIVNGALYLVGFGSGDFLQNYYAHPSLNNVYTPNQYSSYLVTFFSSFIKDLYGLGARRIGVTSLPPLGCLPAAITLYGSHEKGGCVTRMNDDARGFNARVNSAAANLQKQLPGLKMVVFDIYSTLYDLIETPSKYGFLEARKGCCAQGKVEETVFLCDPGSPRTCGNNASQYVFWDSVHPSQAANYILAASLTLQGIDLLG